MMVFTNKYIGRFVVVMLMDMHTGRFVFLERCVRGAWHVNRIPIGRSLFLCLGHLVRHGVVAWCDMWLGRFVRGRVGASVTIFDQFNQCFVRPACKPASPLAFRPACEPAYCFLKRLPLHSMAMQQKQAMEEARVERRDLVERVGGMVGEMKRLLEEDHNAFTRYAAQFSNEEADLVKELICKEIAEAEWEVEILKKALVAMESR